ncbi:hypothetical protein [Prochlorococcus sp. MIT 1300]|uniref:hypothetical protein n=1 Tax=Prochlorococcus sp. MIT 1300 TaxID=3096218 RepID=UPI002A75501F|nr:hypothetical protein [Prochlorococcus sp. MIT 1300]
MVRLEQITALVLAAALAIPSYWFFWSLAGGGGYDRRKKQTQSMENGLIQQKQPQKSLKGLLEP